jgi:quinone-modifying oxidoreductase subunit QmoB
MIGSMVKATMPEEDEEKYTIVAFVCETMLACADMAGLNKLKYSADIRFIQIRCLGSVNNLDC